MCLLYCSINHRGVTMQTRQIVKTMFRKHEFLIRNGQIGLQACAKHPQDGYNQLIVHNYEGAEHSRTVLEQTVCLKQTPKFVISPSANYSN